MAEEPVESRPDQEQEGLTRRESLKLASAILALGTGLGIPLRALAADPESAPQLTTKWYWSREPEGRDDRARLIHTEEISELAQKLLLSDEPGMVHIKWYRNDGRRSVHLGGYDLPFDELKIEWLRGEEPPRG